MTAKSSRIDVVDVKALGAAGDLGNADNQFLGAQLTARARRRVSPSGSDYSGTTTIDIPAGDYTITQLKGMLGLESQSIKISGIKFRGAGPGLTNVVFSPATAGALVFNDYWLSIQFEGISFITTYDGATFMQSYTTHNAQGYIFNNVSWSGPWKYIFDLQGTNNNSEYRFFGCSTSGMRNDGAFLYIGLTSTSDQFLNYWFYGFKHWSTGASIVDAALGGHFHFFGVDASAWCSTITDGVPHYLFNLRGTTHSYGVQSLTVEALRVEAKDNLAALIYSEWASGNVTIECDWSSQILYNTYGDIIKLKFANVGGPLYNFHDSYLAGGVNLIYGLNTYQTSPRVKFENCVWGQKLTPSEVVTWGDESALGSNLTRPGVEFIGCRGSDNDVTDGTNGVSVWDARVGRRTPVMPQAKRSLRIGSTRGNVRDTGASRVSLPIGALITGVQAMAPAGAHTETDGGSWVVATTDGSPVTIATATVAGSMADGYSVSQQLAVPFLCSTRAKATITVTATGVTTGSYDAFLVLEGYW